MEHTIVCYDGLKMVLVDALTGDYQVYPDTTLAAVNSLDALYIDTGANCAETAKTLKGASLPTEKMLDL